MMSNGTVHHVDRIGVFRPAMTEIDELGPGEIGFLTASIKQVRDTRVGDTITHDKARAAEALPGFKPSQPVVFCGLFPVDTALFEDLRDAIEKLALNDASFSYEVEPPPPSASASAAASWASSTSRSSATGSSANTTSTSSPPRPRSSTTSTCATAR